MPHSRSRTTSVCWRSVLLLQDGRFSVIKIGTILNFKDFRLSFLRIFYSYANRTIEVSTLNAEVREDFERCLEQFKKYGTDGTLDDTTQCIIEELRRRQRAGAKLEIYSFIDKD